MTATESNSESSTSQSAHRAVLIRLMGAMALFLNVSVCLAQSELARLLPPDAPVIAGMRRMPHDQAADTLWLATRNNTDDLSRLVALTENDPDRQINHVMVADWASNTDNLGNHLLLAQGRFSLANASSAALRTGAKKLTYDGRPVLALETSSANPSARWLAIPRADLALFGSPSAVQYALDRYRSGAVADAQILQRLKNAHDHDAAWSSVLLDSRPLRDRVRLSSDDNGTLRCLGGIREIGLGIELGDTVKIDLYADPVEGDAASVPVGCLGTALFGDGTPQMRIALGGDRQPGLRVTLARGEYDRWLDSFRKSKVHRTLEAMMAAPAF